jgi:hypothetical protein
MGGPDDRTPWLDVRLQREQLEFLEAQIAKLDAKIQEHMSDYQRPWIYARPFQGSKL